MILLYHKIFPESPTVWWVTVDHFYRQMCELSPRKVVFLDNYDPDDENQVVITFDGVYRNVAEYAAPILQKFGYPFELFVTGDYIGKDNGFDTREPHANFADVDDLKRLIQMGGRLQWHTKSHPNLSDLRSEERIRDELSVPRYLSQLDPAGFNWFAFPHGDHSPELINEVRKRFKGSLSCNQGEKNNQYRMERLIVQNESEFKSSTVTVIIPSYNYGAFLVEAIESALRQTIMPDEILITDDCSSDSTQEIALEYQKKHPHLIRYNRNERNLGIVKNFNKAVSLTSSDFILFLGADNRLMSNYVEETRRVLDSSEKIGIAYTDFALFGPRSRLIYDSFYGDLKGGIKKGYHVVRFPEWDNAAKETLEKRNFIHGSSMYKRKAYNQVGGYREKTGDAEDYDLFLRMVRNGWLAAKCRGTLLEYRQHSREQANIKLAEYSELVFFKERYRELLDEKKRLSSLLIYKLLIPLMLWEKTYSIFRKKGLKELIKRGKTFLRRRFRG